MNEAYLEKLAVAAGSTGMGCVLDPHYGFDCPVLLLGCDPLVWISDFHDVVDRRARGAAAAVYSVVFSKASVAGTKANAKSKTVSAIRRQKTWPCCVRMKRLHIEPGTDFRGTAGWLVWFNTDEASVFVGRQHWVGVDFDGTLARNDNPGHFEPPYPLGEPIPDMLARVKSMLAAGITVKIFTARACEPQNIPIIQDWTERHGLGRLEVTNQKDFNLIRFYDDRAVHPLNYD